MEQYSTGNNSEKIRTESLKLELLKSEISKVIVGQEKIINFALLGILCNGHILLEGVPGIAKTTLIKTISKALGLQFQRIQFTPDLLPADLLGTLIFNPKTQDFETKKGPIFSNLILADEINRAPAKVQSALLEAMQEQQITIGLNTYKLDKPFLVFATQNPIEQEGTYKLPEAQVDRFMFKLFMDYPLPEEEKDIITRSNCLGKVQTVLTHQEILETQKTVDEIYRDEKILDYIVKIVNSTRKPEDFKLDKLKPFIQYGASPRATLALDIASKAMAFLNKRYFVTPDDVKAIATPILRHRITLTYEAEAEGINTDEIIQKMLNTVPSP